MSTIASLLVSLQADFGSTVSQFGQLVHGMRESSEGSEELKELMEDLSKEFVNLAGEATGLVSVFEVLKDSVEISAEIETTRVALEAFTGSAEAATEAMEELEDIARSEALKFPEILPAAQHMMALGFSAHDVEEAMKTAGNASWALGSPLESVSQRMGMMALSGMANNRMLRTLGISTKDLGTVMGVSGNEVSEAFKSMNQEDRLKALEEAMEKFGNMGAKQAKTLSGSWIEMKNEWHAAFLEIGDDLSGVAKVVLKFGADFAVTMEMGIKSLKEITLTVKAFYDVASFSFDGLIAKHPMLAAALALGEKMTHPFAGKQFEQQGPQDPRTDEEKKASETKEDPSLKAAALKALGPERAKIAATAQLEILAGEEQLNSQLSALAKERANADIAATHAIIEAHIKGTEDPLTRQRAEDAEAIRMATEKATRMLTIEESLRDEQIRLAQRRVPLEIASKYQAGPTGEADPVKTAAETLKANEDAKNKIQKLNSDYTLQRLKLQDDITKAVEKGSVAEAEAATKAAEKATEVWMKFKSELDASFRETPERIPAPMKQLTVEEKGGFETGQEAKSQGTTQARMALERAYGLQVIKTAQDQIKYDQEIGDLENKQLAIKAQSAGYALQAAKEAYALAETDENLNAVTKAQADNVTAVNALLNAQIQLETKITEEKQKQTLQYQLQQAFRTSGEAVPGALGGAISGGLFNQGKGGVDIGKQITEAMRNVGKELTSSLLTAAIHQLGLELLKNTVVQTLMHAVGLTQAGGLVANTTASSLNTTALGVVAASNAALVGAIGALIASLAINDVADTLPFAEGGSPPVGIPSIVGERGPELFVPHEAGTVMSNSTLRGLSYSSTMSQSNRSQNNTFQINGAVSPRAVAEQVATLLRNRSVQFQASNNGT